MFNNAQECFQFLLKIYGHEGNNRVWKGPSPRSRTIKLKPRVTTANQNTDDSGSEGMTIEARMMDRSDLALLCVPVETCSRVLYPLGVPKEVDPRKSRMHMYVTSWGFMCLVDRVTESTMGRESYIQRT